MAKDWGIHWFRRDLRVAGNEALWRNHERFGGRTLGIFCFDKTFLGRTDFSHNRFGFFLATLRALRADLKALGGDLLVVDGLPRDAFARIFRFAEHHFEGRPSMVSFGRDYEPFARERDSAMTEYFRGQGVEVLALRDHLLFEPEEIRRGPGADEYFKIYSPWSRKWAAALQTPEGQARVKAQMAFVHDQPKSKPAPFTLKWSNLTRKGDFPFEDAHDEFERANNAHVKIEIPEAGHAAALKELKRFRPYLDNYKRDRDVPAMDATSKLSMFIKNGSLTMAQVLGTYDLKGDDWQTESGRTRFTKELAWREFYYAILYNRPDVEKGPFNKKYVDQKWENNQKLFDHWREGTTGVPIVDAGMRELAQTGWITNRVRIIVSTFLIKDLLVDWRWGENHFMKLLLDGDLAPNNGNWQWSSSTGSDPNPYFRILNPWLQGQKFDPNGDYVRRWVPELAQTPARALHDPEANRTARGYPKPVVDHQVQKAKAIAMFKKSE